MAPKRRRSKVGLTRMDAALDAMRPMGFSSDVVRKCVKSLLQVYGDDGWVFIEEGAYKLLIDTILEEPEVPRLEPAPEHLPLEGDSQGSSVQSEPVRQLYNEEVVFDADIGQKKYQEQERDLHVEVSPVPSQDINAREQEGVRCGSTVTYTPQPSETTGTKPKRKPCYGWISDDEDEVEDDDNFVWLTPANKSIGK